MEQSVKLFHFCSTVIALHRILQLEWICELRILQAAHDTFQDLILFFIQSIILLSAFPLHITVFISLFFSSLLSSISHNT
jgi:hypothetical protein